MEGNDIGDFITATAAVMFEGLAYTDAPDTKVPSKKKWFQRAVADDVVVDNTIRNWKPREMPLKSLLHMVNFLHVNVDVYTYYDSSYIEPIEHWLARKGASVQVFSYEDLEALVDDFKYNRDVHTLYTPFEDDARVLGPRCSVMAPDARWGF